MNAILLTIVATVLFALGAAAQHDAHPSAPPSTQADPVKPAMSGGMMAEHGMMMKHHEAEKLVDDLQKSFAAIQAEKDPAALKVKLAAHGALLNELKAKLQGMMDDKAAMKEMMGSAHKHDAK